MSKLRKIHVIIIGCTACVLVAVGLYFLVIKDARIRIAALEAELQKHTEVYNRLPSAQRKLVEVRDQYNREMASYSRFMRAKMPAISFADRPQGMIALWKEQAEVLGPMLQRWPAKTGVRLLSGVQIPPAPSDPNAITGGCIPISIGTFQVQGDFHTIMRHVRKWNEFGRLVQLSPITISGPSPQMTAQYNVTVLLVPSGAAGPPFQMGSGTEVASN
jgi:hypothetical protein